jgi:hypothetical protein
MVKLSEGMQRLEIGSAQQFAANTTQQAPVDPQSRNRKAPTRKKTREALWLSVHKLGMGQTPSKYSKMDGKCGWK